MNALQPLLFKDYVREKEQAGAIEEVGHIENSNRAWEVLSQCHGQGVDFVGLSPR